MGYVVKTTRPPSAPVGSETKTAETIQDACRIAAEACPPHGYWYEAAAQLPEAGGRIGPLRDGTIIDVIPR
jgi:hypothetical protein